MSSLDSAVTIAPGQSGKKQALTAAARRQQAYMERWMLLTLSSIVLAGFVWIYSRGITRFPEHRTYGGFVVSGNAANQHLDPYAIGPGVWAVHAFRNETGPLIYDRNLQPPIVLPLFQLFARLSIASGVALWMFGSFAIFVAGTAAVLVTFRETLSPWLIPLILLSRATICTFEFGEDFALLFALAAGAVCFLHVEKEWPASICIGVLVAVHWNFGLWPVLLYAVGHRRMAVRAGCIALLLTALPILIYGPSIYLHLLHAIRTDNHSFGMGDISITGFFTRAGHRQIGLALSLCFAWILFFAVRRKKRADPIAIGGLAACSAILFSPLGWFEFLIVAFPCLAPRRLDRFAACGAALMFIWHSFGNYTGHGFIGLCATVHFLLATCLLFISFWRATTTRQPAPPAAFQTDALWGPLQIEARPSEQVGAPALISQGPAPSPRG
jgi:hypothetical protein